MFLSPSLAFLFSRHVLLKLPPNEALLGLLLVLLLGTHVLAVCPSMCSCSRSHREVDCSWRGLRHLPDGLQHNMRSLNLSHNRIHNLDGLLTTHTHLRFLDLSHNRLSHLPVGLPRSLWQLFAAYNRFQLLDKNDTVYQWNLRVLDLSHNKLERAIFINNTLTNLCTLNLSHNHFWTLPTNMPMHLEAIDLSHNLLLKVLPGSLDRLPRLSYLYLHANRFSTLPFGVLDKVTKLRVITLGDNPWACHLYDEITYLLSWSQHTPARVLGCPCHTQSVCGGARPGRTGGWHYASYNLPPLAASAQDVSAMPPDASVTGWWYSALLSTPNTQQHPAAATPIGLSTTPPKSTGTHLTINHLSANGSPGATDRTPHNDNHLVPASEEILPSDSPHTADTSSFLDSVITETHFMTLATDRFYTTESPAVQTKKTTTLRTRSVRRQNQSVISSDGALGPATCSSLSLLLSSFLLQHVL